MSSENVLLSFFKFPLVLISTKKKYYISSVKGFVNPNFLRFDSTILATDYLYHLNVSYNLLKGVEAVTISALIEGITH